MRQARRPSNAMLAKYTGWGTALGSPADENEVKRTAGGPGRKTPAQPPEESVPSEASSYPNRVAEATSFVRR